MIYPAPVVHPMEPTPIVNRAKPAYGLEQSTNTNATVATNATNKPIELNSFLTDPRAISLESISLSLIKPDVIAHDQHAIYGNDEYKPFLKTR